MKTKQQSKQDAHVTNLLISILLRFSEIMSINFDMPHDKCKFTFMTLGSVSKGSFDAFRQKLEDSLEAYDELTGNSLTANAKLKRSGKFSIIEITCKTDRLCLEVIQLITAIMDSEFESSLIRDREIEEEFRDDEMYRQEEAIEYLLSHTGGTKKENLIAFREAGKVYVYDK